MPKKKTSKKAAPKKVPVKEIKWRPATVQETVEMNRKHRDQRREAEAKAKG